ncbi:SMEK domain-containing protein [Tianweitania sp.]|uniref:SMEK domain-containing protein n=1 Tax=Tianweitania sp. TaxID=2021634 RepID=UPI0028A0F97C|nr:SMEK domain-containing protein [Tianweitania sp.]
MRQLEVENELRGVVSRIIVQVELATSQGRTDINLALEDASIPILRSVYNLPRLINPNRKQKNYPGIDLGDDHDRVSFQVTSTTSLDKVNFTIGQFMERSYFNTFDELNILMLARKQPSYSQASVDTLLTDQFSFNCKKHIIDLTGLLGLVAGLRLAARERALAQFELILGEVDAFISYSNSSVAAPMSITSNLQKIRLPLRFGLPNLVSTRRPSLNAQRRNFLTKIKRKGAGRSSRRRCFSRVCRPTLGPTATTACLPSTTWSKVASRR